MIVAPALDIAWAAGLYEGEGSICVDRTDNRKKRGKATLQMSLSTTDHDVIVKFCSIVGGRVNGPYWHARSTKPYWRWDLRNEPEVSRLAELFAPFLGTRRKEQLEAALTTKREADAIYRPKPFGPPRAPRVIAGQIGLKW